MFLRDHNQPIYFEVVQLYTNTMNKIYIDNFKTYICKFLERENVDLDNRRIG